MDKPTNLAEYVDLIDAAIHELEELISCSQGEYDNDMDRLLQRYQTLLVELKTFAEEVRAGHIVPGEHRDQGLKSLEATLQAGLPAHSLVYEIDRIAREGYEG